MSSPTAATSLPSTTKAWQYTAPLGRPLEDNIRLQPSVPLPKLGKNESLIRVHTAALNPVDYKIPEIPWPISYFLPSPSTAGLDFSGWLVETTDPKLTGFKGQLVFGCAAPGPKYGSMAEYTVVKSEAMIQPVPQSVDPADAAAATLVAITAYQSIVSRLCQNPRATKLPLAGKSIFINGGSGGCGVYGIQIAKALGASKVTATCSTGNVEMVKGLGADQVIDYKKEDMCQTLRDEVDTDFEGKGYDLAIDNVGAPPELYQKADAFLKPGASFVQVAGTPNLAGIKLMLTRALLPSFLGGGKRKWTFLSFDSNRDDAAHLAEMMEKGEVKSVIAKHFAFDEVPDAYRMLKRGSGNGGKIVVDVARE